MASPPTRLRDRLLLALLPRADAAATRDDASDLSGSAVENTISGLGANRDSGAQARPNRNREFLDMEELIACLRGTAYRRIVSLHPQWATVKGWELSDDTDENDPEVRASCNRPYRVSKAKDEPASHGKSPRTDASEISPCEHHDNGEGC